MYEKNVRESSRRVVYLSGEIKKTGNFSCEENLTIADLLLKGGGFTEKAWIFDAEISRIPPEGISGDSLSHLFVVPLIDMRKEIFSREVMTDLILTRKTVASEFRLKPNDHVFIRANPDYEPLKTVSITGEVLYPGEYTIKSRNITLSELIERAGGVRKSAFLPGGQLIRKNQRVYIDFEKVIEKKNVKENIILLPGDQIVIPPRMNTVTVIGKVINPGFYKYVKGIRISEYLNQSGGKTKYGDKVYVTEPSGRTRKLSIFNNMKVQEGSVITVRAKIPEKTEKINWSEVVRDSFIILTGALTIVYLADRVSE